MHGAAERRFRLHRARDDRPDAAASMALQERRHGFASAVAALAAELVSYLGRSDGGPTADSAGWLAVPAGARAVVASMARFDRAQATAWNLTIGTDHTFFVSAGGVPVLVHNEDCEAPDKVAELGERGTAPAGGELGLAERESSRLPQEYPAGRIGSHAPGTAQRPHRVVGRGPNIIVIYNKALEFRSTAYLGTFAQFLGLR